MFLAEIIEMGYKAGIVWPERVETVGRMSDNFEMIL